MKILVTGAAGFIGAALSIRLLERGDEVIGLDNLNDYYEVSLKEARLARLYGHPRFRFLRVRHLRSRGDGAGLRDRAAAAGHAPRRASGCALLLDPSPCLRGRQPRGVHDHPGGLPTQRRRAPRVRLFQLCLRRQYPHALLVHDNVDHPLSLYAATKKANELMAHTYSHLYGLPVTGLRFFTVYGPWGRPDMSLFLFTRSILAGQPIEVFNYGHHRRDFTYIDDPVEGVMRAIDAVARPNPTWSGDSPDPGTSRAPYRLYNIGNNHPVKLLRFIEVLEGAWARVAEKKLLPLQPGDVPDTYADVKDLVDDVAYGRRRPWRSGWNASSTGTETTPGG